MKRYDFERILEDGSHPDELAAYGRSEKGFYQSEESYTNTKVDDLENKFATLALMLYKNKDITKRDLEILYDVPEES